MGNPEEVDQVQAIQRFVRIMTELSERKRAGITELSESTGLAKSTVHRYLDTLHDLHYVVRDGQKYCLSMQFLTIGESARERHPSYQLAVEKVDQLAAETNERCQFVVEEHGRGIYAYVSAGSNAVLTESDVGKQIYLHSTSVGKAILAHMPESRVDKIIEQWGLPRRTVNTITDQHELLDELESIRQEGVAFNYEGNIEGLRSVGSPVLNTDGEVIGGISVAGPTHRLQGSWYTEEIPHQLMGVTNEIRLRLKYEED